MDKMQYFLHFSQKSGFHILYVKEEQNMASDSFIGKHFYRQAEHNQALTASRFCSFSLCHYKKEGPLLKADSHGDLYAPKSIFSRNTAKKIHGRRQPCRGFFYCLAEKSFSLECFAVLNRRFFFTAATGDRVNTGCIPRETGAVVEEKIHSKPCKSLCESAQGQPFFFMRDSIISIYKACS